MRNRNNTISPLTQGKGPSESDLPYPSNETDNPWAWLELRRSVTKPHAADPTGLS